MRVIYLTKRLYSNRLVIMTYHGHRETLRSHHSLFHTSFQHTHDHRYI